MNELMQEKFNNFSKVIESNNTRLIKKFIFDVDNRELFTGDNGIIILHLLLAEANSKYLKIALEILLENNMIPFDNKHYAYVYNIMTSDHTTSIQTKLISKVTNLIDKDVKYIIEKIKFLEHKHRKYPQAISILKDKFGKDYPELVDDYSVKKTVDNRTEEQRTIDRQRLLKMLSQD